MAVLGETQFAPITSAVGDTTLVAAQGAGDRKSTRLNSSHSQISYAVFCLKKKTNKLPSTSPFTLNRPHRTFTRCKSRPTYLGHPPRLTFSRTHATVLADTSLTVATVYRVT